MVFSKCDISHYNVIYYLLYKICYFHLTSAAHNNAAKPLMPHISEAVNKYGKTADVKIMNV